MQATYIEVQAFTRYWEDSEVNGIEDTEGVLIPFRVGDCWSPVIRLVDGMVMGWPAGTTAKIHYKVCDAGEYWLLNTNHQRIARWLGFYVPDLLCPGTNGYGDYIIMSIGPDGLIEKWRDPRMQIAHDSEYWGNIDN